MWHVLFSCQIVANVDVYGEYYYTVFLQQNIMTDKLALIKIMSAFASMANDPLMSTKRSNPKLDSQKPKKPIPKGCKEYTFNEGHYIFKCVAINKSSAIKKFKKWKNTMK